MTPKRGSLISPQVKAILQEKDKVERIKYLFREMHPHDIFVLCENLEDEEIAEIVKALAVPTGIEFFEEFDDERKIDIFNCFSQEWMADVLEEMAPDERVDFVKLFPDATIEAILPLVARAERLDIRKLISYKEGTAGSILTSDYAHLSANITIREAVEKLKQQAFDRETIYYIYVIDDERRLLGFISLRDIIIAPSSKRIADVMHKNVISANVDDDKEDVAKQLSDYDFLAIPVVDIGNRLVGIVTVDDVVDVVEEEATEDIYKLGAAGEVVDYFKSSSFALAKQRAVWLLLLIGVGFSSAWILEYNSEALKAIVALSFFIPLLLGAGGNAGTQSSTVVIRGLATEDIELHDVWRVIKKELTVGLIVGSFMAIIGSLMASFLDKDPRMGITVGLAMILTVMLATFLGATLPILFKRFGWDPALMSGPFITVIVDIVSLIVYFKIALFVFT